MFGVSAAKNILHGIELQCSCPMQDMVYWCGISTQVL